MSDLHAMDAKLFRQVPQDAMARGRWLGIFRRLQDLALIAWLAFVAFLPQNVNSLVGLFMLTGLWGLALVVGGWHFFKFPTQRRHALWVIVAFPAIVLLSMLLNSTLGLPVTEARGGQWLFLGALCAFPLYWLGRWLLRATKSRSGNSVRTRLTTTIFLAVLVILTLQSFFLIGVLFSGASFASFRGLFGGDWYVNLLLITLGTTAFVSLAAVPFAILGLVRGTGHRGALVGILVCATIPVISTLGVLGLFSMLSYG